MKILNFILMVIVTFIVFSCNEDINPNADFRERYIMNCVLKSDSTIQTVTILKTYKVDDFDPYTNTENPFIQGADVKVWFNNKIYQFKDSSSAGNSSDRFEGDIYFYYNKDIVLESGKYLEIESLLPNGLRLSSILKTPSSEIDFDGSEVLIPPESGNKTLIFKWNDDEENILYAPRFVIRYYNYINGTGVLKYKDVPIKYVDNNENEAVYPEPSKNKGYSISVSDFEKALVSIAPTEGQRKNYTILGFSILLQLYDENLSIYYSSIQNSSDPYTVNLNENNFTNIEGGYGIFGAYMTKEHKILFDRDYILSLGFKPGF